jgi:hypothetical protein
MAQRGGALLGQTHSISKRGNRELAGRQGVSADALENPCKDRRFQHDSHDASNLALRILSPAFVRSRPFSDFPSAMTLERSWVA